MSAPTEPKSLYAQAYEMAAEGAQPDDIVQALGLSEETREGGLHGSIHGFCVDAERQLRAMSLEDVTAIMFAISLILKAAKK